MGRAASEHSLEAEAGCQGMAESWDPALWSSQVQLPEPESQAPAEVWEESWEERSLVSGEPTGKAAPGLCA